MLTINVLLERDRMMGEYFAAAVAVATLLFIYIGGLMVCYKLDLLTSNTKKVQKAVKLGHVVKAYYVDGSRRVEQMETAGGNKYDRYTSSYKYIVEGKEYRVKGIMSVGLPRDTITLYYIDRPEKAFLYNEVTDKKVIRNIMPIILFVTALIAAGKVYNLFS